MLGVKAGGDRQALHEVIRQESWAVTDAMEQGAENDLLDRLANHQEFSRVGRTDLQAELDPSRHVGRSAEQVGEFIEGTVDALLESLREFTVEEGEVSV